MFSITTQAFTALLGGGGGGGLVNGVDGGEGYEGGWMGVWGVKQETRVVLRKFTFISQTFPWLF